MPSDLQRVARGLVECLDEVPQVVAHLQRTAERCRENAALAISASRGQATVAAQQLDAAARACEQAAHYLSMAPPKAKAWAERLVGASRSGDRPDASSADRNKATGGVGDVAERDLLGRVTRTSLPFKPLEDAEGKEPPLITVARKAFEKFRKKQEKEEEQREQPEELEVEIVVAETGEVEVLDQDPFEERDFEIQVDLTAAATELLKAMEESGKQSWTAATITLTLDRVTGTFSYPDLPEPLESPVIDVELPPPPADTTNRETAEVEVPAIEVDLDEAPDFDPAFHPRALGEDFAPGVFDPANSFKLKERAVADRLTAEGWRVDARPADHHVQNKKNPDVMVRKNSSDRGVVVEFKTLDSGNPNTVKRNMTQGSGQVRSAVGEVVIDGRRVGLAETEAFRAFKRACNQPGASAAARIHVILGDGRLVTYTKEN